WMIREIGVAAVPGSSFFKENVNNYVRFHFAKKEETLKEAIRRLKKLKDYEVK
ncbi:MAG: aminotransferase, partial [Anaerostipes faecalis]|nr:aminotransferase [Anaerostipes faecalis]